MTGENKQKFKTDEKENLRNLNLLTVHSSNSHLLVKCPFCSRKHTTVKLFQ